MKGYIEYPTLINRAQLALNNWNSNLKNKNSNQLCIGQDFIRLTDISGLHGQIPLCPQINPLKTKPIVLYKDSVRTAL
jgi:hypothetical protein